MKIEFSEFDFDLDKIEGMNGLKYAMAVAVAGRLNLLAVGKPGCGKTMVLQCMPQLLPNLSDEEKVTTDRLYSLAGMNYKDNHRPFRMPHQTCTIEGACGGGANCHPGEISLAHNGVLFLDEAAEFRSSVLQMLRVPLETHQITLSRAGRTTVYPARFQLVMATNPCPCGNYGVKDRICLCSARAIEQYWKKFSAPLLDRIHIMWNCDDKDTYPKLTVEELRRLIKTAYEMQVERGEFNGNLTDPSKYEMIANTLTDCAKKILDTEINHNDWSPRKVRNIVMTARTIADMYGWEEINDFSINEALDLRTETILDL